MKETIAPTRNFLRMFEKAEKARLKTPKLLSEFTGFNENFCEKNASKIMKNLNEDQKKEINDAFLLSQILKNKMWSDFYFLNFDKVRNYLVPPSYIKFNEKKGIIELSDGSKTREKFNKIVRDFKNKLSKFVKI